MSRKLTVRAFDWLAQQFGDLANWSCAVAYRLDGRDLTRYERQHGNETTS
jgi:hypothetical protein